MLENLYLFSVATIVLALSPGPDNIYVLTQSLVNGSKSGLATTFGLISGCIIHTALLAFGVSAIITANETLFYAIKILGACYLLYLAYKVFSSDSDILLGEKAPSKTPSQLYKQGFIMNLLNPKVMIFFLAFFPAFIWNSDEETVSQFFILGGIFMVVSLFVFGALALLAGSISAYLRNNKNVGFILKWLQIIVFIGIAVFILIP